MASQGVAANSRLAQMQMRFQQKQLQEREQKKLALTTGDIGNDNSPGTARNAVGNGKVREMFERRRGVGIDRSHPLKPITSTTTTVTTKTTTNQHQQPTTIRRVAGGGNTMSNNNTTRRMVINTKQSTTTSNMRNSHSNPDAFSSNNNLFGSDLDEMDNLDSETFPKEFSSLSLDNTRIMGAIVHHDGNNNNLNRSMNGMGQKDVMDTTITINKRPNTNGIKLNPVIMKKSPNTARTTNPTGATAAGGPSRTPQNSAGRVSVTSRTSTTSTNGSTMGSTKSTAMKKPTMTTSTASVKGVKTTPKGINGKSATFVLAAKPPPRVTTPPPGMANCQYCQRNFNEDRLEKHQEVCRKMTAKKRKIFDASKHRVQGTEAEKYVRKSLSKASTTATPKIVASSSNSSNAGATDGKKNNWRKKHEEFINAIREAKKVQAYLAKGGKLSDLPPPPPSENPDYVQCPHCSRRFNESAAERHIPKCATMKHNKPKPATQKKRY